MSRRNVIWPDGLSASGYVSSTLGYQEKWIKLVTHLLFSVSHLNSVDQIYSFQIS